MISELHPLLLRSKALPWINRGLLALLLALSHSAMVSAEVLIVLSGDSAPYTEVVSGIKSAWARVPDTPPVFNVLSVQGGSVTPDLLADKKVEAIVTVGVQAAQLVTRAETRAPVLLALVPKFSADKLAATRRFTVLYLDQPVKRQVALIQLALPQLKRLGVIVGPESQDRLKLLQSAVREQKIQLAVERIDSADEMLPALQRVLADSDALLALPDPLVFNKNNAHSVLLTSYRYHDPVIGYSQAYVKAGAMFGVYSTPAQIGQQAGEIVQRLSAARSAALPTAFYPKYFSVSVNEQVARSLGVSLENESVLAEKLKQVVEQEP